MFKEQRSADEIRVELDRVARALAADGSGKQIRFLVPTRAPPIATEMLYNWDVQCECPEGMDDIARQAFEAVAEKWDLEDS